MNDQPKRPACARCGKEIVGVIPQWEGDRPVCRECAYAGPVRVPRYLRRIPRRLEARAAGAGNNHPRKRVTLVLGGTLLLLAALTAGILWTSLEFGQTGDGIGVVYEGNATLDRKGRQCASNLMVLSEYLSRGAVSWPTRVCPETGDSYRVTRIHGDVTIDCPNPGRHGLSRLWVSMKRPVVKAEGR